MNAKAILLQAAQKLGDSTHPLLGFSEERVLFKLGVIEDGYSTRLTWPEDDPELAGTERVLLCLFAANLCD